MLNLFGEHQPEPQSIKLTRVMFSFGEQFPEGKQEALVCVGKIIPRTPQDAPDSVNVVLEPENCYVWTEYGCAVDGLSDADFTAWESTTGIRKVPNVGWVASCEMGKYQVLS